MLEARSSTTFKSLAVMLNYMSMGRADVQYWAKDICTKMARPSQGSWERLKETGRLVTG